MGKHHNKMPKERFEMYVAESQRTPATNHGSQAIDRSDKKFLGYYSDRLCRRNYVIDKKAPAPPPPTLIQRSDGARSGLDFILHRNNGTSLYDPCD